MHPILAGGPLRPRRAPSVDFFVSAAGARTVRAHPPPCLPPTSHQLTRIFLSLPPPTTPTSSLKTPPPPARQATPRAASRLSSPPDRAGPTAPHVAPVRLQPDGGRARELAGIASSSATAARRPASASASLAVPRRTPGECECFFGLSAAPRADVVWVVALPSLRRQSPLLVRVFDNLDGAGGSAPLFQTSLRGPSAGQTGAAKEFVQSAKSDYSATSEAPSASLCVRTERRWTDLAHPPPPVPTPSPGLERVRDVQDQPPYEQRVVERTIAAISTLIIQFDMALLVWRAIDSSPASEKKIRCACKIVRAPVRLARPVSVD